MDANGEWSVQWDTRTAACSNGTQDLDTWAFRDDGSDLGHATITVEVDNSSPPPPPDPEPVPVPFARSWAGGGAGIPASILRLLRHAQPERLVLESVVGTDAAARHPVRRGRRSAPRPPPLRRISERDRVVRAVRPGIPEELPVRLHGGADEVGHRARQRPGFLDALDPARHGRRRLAERQPLLRQPRTAEGAVPLRRARRLRGLREHQRRLPE